MTTIAQARAQLAERGSRSLPEPELRQFLAIGAAVRAARTAVELVAALLQRASTGGQAECLAAVVETTLNARARRAGHADGGRRAHARKAAAAAR
jgi:hypothetical protein